MAKIKLTKREYLGEGFWHYFRNDDTGEVIREACTKEEYHRLGEVGGSRYNPIKDGFTYFQSAGGTIDVDSPSKQLEANEYTEIGDKAYIWTDSEKISSRLKVCERSEIKNNEIEKTWQ